MLRRVNHPDGFMDPGDALVRIADASFPVPFEHRLEFNAPVHGTWNIVHIGMLVPECHQIYVCSDNCMRGVVLTAAEMGAADRFSSVLIEENDLYDGNLENITIEGVTDAINRLPYRPRAVAVFLVCLHHFVGTDAAYVYRTLEERFPDIDFMRCWMDPVMQKTGLTPEQKLKESMFKPVRPLPVEPGLVCVLGDNQPLDPDSDIAETVRISGGRILQLHNIEGVYAPIQAACCKSEKGHLQGCRTYEDYLRIGAAQVLITRSPAGIHGVSQLAKRLGRPFLYLPPACGEGEIRTGLERLEILLSNAERSHTSFDTDIHSNPGTPSNSCSNNVQGGSRELQAACQRAQQQALIALEQAHSLIGNTEIKLDHIVSQRPLSLARLLLEHGFNVTGIYLDVILPEEEQDFHWLKENHPDLLLSATIHPKMRVLHASENTGELIGLGPKAAWFGGTRHFVNVIEFGGMWGFSGIKKFCDLMEDAFLHEKDTRKLVPRKGLGCACVL